MIEILNKSLLIREAEKKLLEAYKERYFGGTVHTCLGQEVCPSIISTLVPENTKVVSNHRGHGHYIAHSNDTKGLFCEFLGKSTSPSSGIGGSQHLHNDNFISNGIQGCTAPFAVGISIKRPVVFYLGDGTFGEGALYEALNLSKLVKGNILFVVEDNSISQSTPSIEVLSGTIANKFKAFDIDVINVDSSNPIEMLNILKTESETWFKQQPKAIVVKSYRLYSHSKGDDTRNEREISELPDPLSILAHSLSLSLSEFTTEAKTTINAIWEEALSETDLEYSENKQVAFSYKNQLQDLEHDKRINVVINEAIDNCLSDGALYIGEDIKTKWHEDDHEYGGAFGVSLGLSCKHNNVISTSISESGLVGVAAGYAYQTKRLAIAEIMFADFSTLIVDQLLNGVDKYSKMFGKQIKIPLAVRIPYGMGRGYGPTHSQIPMELFSSLTECHLVSYNCLLSYDSILNNIQKTGESTLIFESKTQYGDRLSSWSKLLSDFAITEISGKISSAFLLKNSANPKLNIVTHGSYAKNTIEYITKNNIEANVLIQSEIYTTDDFLSVFNKKIPLVIIEECNSDFSPLKVMVSLLNINNQYKGKIVFTKPVKNIPANQAWEQQLMLDELEIARMINEALS